MTRLLKVAFDFIRPIEPAPPECDFAVELEMRVRAEGSPIRNLAATIAYQHGSELWCRLSERLEDEHQSLLLEQLAQGTARLVLEFWHGLGATYIEPVPSSLRIAWKLRLIGNSGSEFVAWQAGEDI